VEKALPYIVLLTAAMMLGGILGRSWFPLVVQSQPIVTYVDRPILQRDTVTVVRPVTRTIYQRVEELVRDTIYVPVGFDYVGLISPSPIRFDRGDIILTYYGVRDSAFVQDRFEIPKRKWGFSIATTGGYEFVTRKPEIGVETSLRYKRVGTYMRASTTIESSQLGVGLRFYLVGG
jgi:hypothetical protein